MKKKVTIRDVAAATNLSITQVSKALNGYPDVSAKSKKLVIDTAAKLGYVPDKGARSLASKKQTEVTVLNLATNNNLISENIFRVLAGVYAQAELADLQVNVVFISKHISETVALSQYLIQNSILNPIIIGLNEKHPYYEQIAAENFNFTCFVLDNKFDKANIINVNVDDNLSIKLVADFLVKKAYYNTLVVGASNNSYVTQTRTDAIYEHFSSAKINYTFIDGNYEYKKAQSEIYKFGDKLKTVDAVFCFSDIMAIGVNAAMHELGIHRPIIGFDGLEITDYVYPKISTVSQSFAKKGEEIVKCLTADTLETNDITVKPQLIER